MKVKCLDNKIEEWELQDRILGNLEVGQIYEVEYEFIATNGLKSQDMYYLKDKGPFSKERFEVVS